MRKRDERRAERLTQPTNGEHRCEICTRHVVSKWCRVTSVVKIYRADEATIVRTNKRQLVRLRLLLLLMMHRIIK